MPNYPYKDPQLSTAERVSDLLGRMTLAEKIAQMYSHWLILFRTAIIGSVPTPLPRVRPQTI